MCFVLMLCEEIDLSALVNCQAFSSGGSGGCRYAAQLNSTIDILENSISYPSVANMQFNISTPWLKLGAYFINSNRHNGALHSKKSCRPVCQYIATYNDLGTG